MKNHRLLVQSLSFRGREHLREQIDAETACSATSNGIKRSPHVSDCFPVVKKVLPAIAIAIDVQHSTEKQSDGIFTITVTPRNAARVQICGVQHISVQGS